MSGELINTDGLGSALMYIADKLNITLQQMYEIYARAQFFMGIVQIAMILIWCIVMIVVFVLITKYLKLITKSDSIFEFDVMMPTLMAMLIVGSVFGVILTFLYNPILAIMCPDYMALKSMIYDIGQMVK